MHHFLENLQAESENNSDRKYFNTKNSRIFQIRFLSVWSIDVSQYRDANKVTELTTFRYSTGLVMQEVWVSIAPRSTGSPARIPTFIVITCNVNSQYQLSIPLEN